MYDLTDTDVAELIDLEKHVEVDEKYAFPEINEKVHISLLSSDKREKFFLDINRGSIDLRRVTYQTRSKIIYPLVRLDISGRNHRNPDGKELGVPHVHVYSQGFSDKWAYPPEEIFGEKFKDLKTMVEYLDIFMDYCKIITKPDFDHDLFSSI
ncbi:hypothetical protein AB3N62_11155 [Leptospira sp. WS4.C2]